MLLRFTLFQFSTGKMSRIACFVILNGSEASEEVEVMFYNSLAY